MAHRILVLSPLHNMGSTVASCMIAQGATYSGYSSTLLFTEPRSPIPDYLGVDTIVDPTRNITQVVELINAGSMPNAEIINYAHAYEKNAYLMNTADPSLTDRAKLQTVTYIYERVQTDIVVCDCSDDLGETITSDLLEMSQMIFIVIDMSPKSVRYLKHWMQQKQFKGMSNVFVIISKYDESVVALRDFAKTISMPANRVCKVHYNPWIRKCCFSGTLATILPLAQTLDYRVAALKNDITEFNQAIEGDLLLSSRQGL